MGRSGPRVSDTRLDPVRWGRPTRDTVVRFTAVAVLVAVAAMMTWSRPRGCDPPVGARPSATASRQAALPGTSPELVRARPQSSGTAVPPGTVGVPVRLTEPAALHLVHAGDRVDLLRVDAADDSTTPVASAALVLGVTGADDPAIAGLLLALSPADARKAVTPHDGGFAVLVRPG
jgi:hypothetical protein